MLRKCASKEYSIERPHDGHHVLFRSQINARLFFRRQNHYIKTTGIDLFQSSKYQEKKEIQLLVVTVTIYIPVVSFETRRIVSNQFTTISGSWRKDEIEYQATYM
jgi:hypothetical protein